MVFTYVRYCLAPVLAFAIASGQPGTRRKPRGS